MKNVLIIGAGGREHALCWKLAQSKNVSAVHVFPGSQVITQIDKTKIVSGLDLKDFQVGISACDLLLSALFSYSDQCMRYSYQLQLLPPVVLLDNAHHYQ